MPGCPREASQSPPPLYVVMYVYESVSSPPTTPSLPAHAASICGPPVGPPESTSSTPPSGSGFGFFWSSPGEGFDPSHLHSSKDAPSSWQSFVPSERSSQRQ